MARRRDLTRVRRQLCLLAVVAFALGLGASGGARAQTEEPAGVASLYSQVQADGEASGLNISYGLQDFTVPTIAQGAVPIARSELTADPSARGLASILYPGPLIAGLGAVVAQANPDADGFVPPYPVVAEAAYPGDKTEDTQGGGTMHVTTSGTRALSVASYTAPADVPGLDQVVRAGSMVSSAQSALESGDIVSRARSVTKDVSILDGLITIDSIVTDLVARSNGTAAATDGRTVVNGVRFLGLDAVLDADGLRLEQAPASGAPTDPLGDLTGPIADGLSPVTEQLSAVMTEVLGQATTNLNDLLARGGVSIRVLEPNEVVNGAQGSRIANGVLVESTFVGSDQPLLVELVNLVPPDQRGAIGDQIPNPVTMLVETHITTMSIGAGTVAVAAQPPFEIPPIVDGPGVLPTGETNAPDTSDGGFESALPPIDDVAEPGTSLPGAEPISNALGDALPAVAVILLLLASPLFATGSTRLADNVLSEAISGCPEGLDRPLPSEG